MANATGRAVEHREDDLVIDLRQEVCMHTWPELLAHLKQLEKLVVKHPGSKRKKLERRIVDLQAQARKISSRELGVAKHHPPK
jgi:hypothetical protein